MKGTSDKGRLALTHRQEAPNRLLIIGKKRLPDVARKERFYGFVEATAGAAAPPILHLFPPFSFGSFLALACCLLSSNCGSFHW